MTAKRLLELHSVNVAVARPICEAIVAGRLQPIEAKFILERMANAIYSESKAHGFVDPNAEFLERRAFARKEP